MMRDGVQLFAEADRFQEVAGVMIACCHPPNLSALGPTSRCIDVVLCALRDKFLSSVSVNHPTGEARTDEQKRFNFTRSQIKQDCAKFRKRLRRQLAKQIWTG